MCHRKNLVPAALQTYNNVAFRCWNYPEENGTLSRSSHIRNEGQRGVYGTNGAGYSEKRCLYTTIYVCTVCVVCTLTIFVVQCLSKMIVATPAVMNWENTHKQTQRQETGDRKSVSIEEHYITSQSLFSFTILILRVRSKLWHPHTHTGSPSGHSTKALPGWPPQWSQWSAEEWSRTWPSPPASPDSPGAHVQTHIQNPLQVTSSFFFFYKLKHWIFMSKYAQEFKLKGITAHKIKAFYS